MTITAPMQQVVVFNTPLAKESIGATTKTYAYKRTPPMPSYLLCIAVGPFESVAIPGLSVPGRIYTVKGQKHLTKLAAHYAPPVLDALEAYFGRPYPYEKLDLIGIPEYWPGAMENPGAVTYADNILLVDSEAASISQKRTLVRVHAHEFAHMWFGDLVTMAWWDDLWLNESFADWMGDKITDQLYPELKLDVSELRSVQRLMKGDARPSTVPVRKPVDSTGDIMDGLMLAYGKGKTVLRMVEVWIGEDDFRTGVRRYIDRYAWKNTRANDLFTALSQAADQDLTPILSTFFEQPGYPVVRVDVGSGGVINLSQKRFLNSGIEAEDYLWRVPVRLKISDGETIQTRTLLLDKESERVEVSGDVDWVMPNQGAYGYYRWSAPAEMIYKIAADPENTMDERERAVFLANVGALLDAGEIGGDEYFTILGSLGNHPNPEVVDGVMDALEAVYGAFVTDEIQDAFAHYVRETLGPALEAHGMSPREGETETVTLMRPRMLRWLGGPGHHEAVREHCVAEALRYIDDPISIDASYAGSCLRVAAIDGDAARYDIYLKKFETTDVPAERSRFLAALGYFSDSALQDRTLEYVAQGNVRPNEVFRIVQGIAKTDKGREKVMRWMMDNYEVLTSRIPTPFHSYMPHFVSGCSEERLQAAQVFFSDPAHIVDGTESNMKKISDRIMDCVTLREREGPRVADYLNKLTLAD
jgi:alanyl aminopeptidase